MQRLHVAYNFGCRALYNLPWRACVSSHQVQCNNGTFLHLRPLRKNTYCFLKDAESLTVVACFDAGRLFVSVLILRKPQSHFTL